MASIKVIGVEGRAFLQSVGFDLRESSHKKFHFLDNHYGKKERFFC